MRRFKSNAGQERAAYLSALLVLAFQRLTGLFKPVPVPVARPRRIELGRPSQAAAL